MTFELRMLALMSSFDCTSRACLACREHATRYLCTPVHATRPCPVDWNSGPAGAALRNFVETFPLLASAVLIAYVANSHKSDKYPRITAGK